MLFYISFFILLLFSLLCKVSSLYTHTRNRQYSELGRPFIFEGPNVIYMKDSFPDCMSCQMEDSCREVASNVSQGTEWRYVGTKVSGYVTKFSHWRSYGVGKVIL